MLNFNVIPVLTKVSFAIKIPFVLLFWALLCTGCENTSNMSNPHNKLAKSQSPYLLQHAQNPVHWYPWGDEALGKAKAENKLLIVSIGYSACHWCHVMEHEVFENDSAAAVMNNHFVSIKVDREERPDIDEIYMRALQLMTNQGGWPLNVVCLPDGKPIWGATYVPRAKWMQVLEELAKLYQEDREKVESYAEQLTQGIQQSQLIALKREVLSYRELDADSVFETWRSTLDLEEGGPKRAPKFPMPVNLDYLLEYATLSGNEEAWEHVKLSLQKMAFGGIYDQIGGGFARYSVDAIWKVPHFEKMLYDNAQLISLYAKAFRVKPDTLYQEVVEQSIDFLIRELKDDSGAFYSALDADSEGEEGKFYVWTASELQELIPPEDWALFAVYYNVNEKGLWENSNYILLRDKEDQKICADFNISPKKLRSRKKVWLKRLMEAREKREKPGLDDKALSSWNGLTISAFCEAYKSFKNPTYLAQAEETAHWILQAQSKDQQLNHAWRRGQSHIDGLLEDYAFAIQAFLDLYSITGKEPYVKQALNWTEFVTKEFEDRNSGLFYTRPHSGEQLIARSMETADNVIPSANSVMAHNLFRLGLIYGKSAYTEQARQNLGHLKEKVKEYGESYANWARLGLYQAYPYYEVAISGKEARDYFEQLMPHLYPNCLWLWSSEESRIPVLENRLQEGQTLIYPCQEGSCQMPMHSAAEFKDFAQDFNKLTFGK